MKFLSKGPIFSLLWLGCFTGCKTDSPLFCSLHYRSAPTANISRIAFGSCSSQNKDQPILNAVAAKQNDLFIYLGDNIYGDTEDMNVLISKYGKLSCKPEFQNLVQSCEVLATWDDHDYGVNDGGAEYPQKEASKNIFLDFWNEPATSERRAHPGIYTSYYYGDSAHRVQILILDLRTFRTPLIEDNTGYIPNFDSSATILGDAQWTWLRTELYKPAKVRIIASSTQFARSGNGYEAWANFPLEQNRLFKAIRDAQADGVLFISGDVHMGELSRIQPPNIYPLYDMTSSGITQLEGEDIPNLNRVGDVYLGYNTGAVEIDWTLTDPLIQFKLYDQNGSERYSYSVHLSEISF